jgi:ribulose kinase
VAEAISSMTQTPSRTFLPRPEVARTYLDLFEIYRQCHDHFGRSHAALMKQLKIMKQKTRGG